MMSRFSFNGVLGNKSVSATVSIIKLEIQIIIAMTQNAFAAVFMSFVSYIKKLKHIRFNHWFKESFNFLKGGFSFWNIANNLTFFENNQAS